MMKKYVVHPGRIKSKPDGGERFVGYWQLIRRYGVDSRECINAGRCPEPFWPKGAKHLFPDYDGNYTLPD